MKKIIIPLCCFIFPLSSTLANSKSDQAAALYKEALGLEKKGEYKSALEKLQQATKLNPELISARQKLTSLSSSAPKLLYAQKVAALKKVNIEMIDLEDASLQNAMKKYAHAISSYNRKHKTAHLTNFVIHDPKKKLADRKITLKLENVPATTVLDNITKLSSSNYKLEEYMITLKPNH